MYSHMNRWIGGRCLAVRQRVFGARQTVGVLFIIGVGFFFEGGVAAMEQNDNVNVQGS
jgi:hypothetical protein